MSTAREIQERAAEAEARRATEIAERAKTNGTARGPAPVVVRHDPSIIRQPPDDPHAAQEPIELRVIRFMAQHGTCTAGLIADRLDISKPRVDAALVKLVAADKVVEEAERVRQARGRPARQFTLLDGADEELELADEEPESGEDRPKPSPQDPFADVDLGMAICAHEPCGAEFQKVHPRQKFCNLICRERDTRARRDRSQRPLDEPRPCGRADCNYDFTPDTPAQKFCSDECRAEDERARKIESRRNRQQEAPVAEPREEPELEKPEWMPPAARERFDDNPSEAASLEDRYFALLMKKAEDEDDPEKMGILFDRIERLIEARIA